jgi:hypothetical protein
LAGAVERDAPQALGLGGRGERLQQLHFRFLRRGNRRELVVRCNQRALLVGTHLPWSLRALLAVRRRHRGHIAHAMVLSITTAASGHDRIGHRSQGEQWRKDGQQSRREQTDGEQTSHEKEHFRDYSCIYAGPSGPFIDGLRAEPGVATPHIVSISSVQPWGGIVSWIDVRLPKGRFNHTS